MGKDGVVHAHTDRRRYGLPLQPARSRRGGLGARGRALGAAPADGSAWRVGFAPSALGATRESVVGVIVPESELPRRATLERVLMVAIFVTIAVLVFWSLIASRAIVAPVRALVAATRRIARGDLEISVPARGGPELGELAGSFNQMAAELAAGRKRLAAAERDQAWAEMARQVAHEVKNPLLPMRMAAQLLQRAPERDPRADMVADRPRNGAGTDAGTRPHRERLPRLAGVAPEAKSQVRFDDWPECAEQCAGLFLGKAVVVRSRRSRDACRDRRQRVVARENVNLVQNAHGEAAPAGVSRLRSRTNAAPAGRRSTTVPGAWAARAVVRALSRPSSARASICRRLVEGVWRHDPVVAIPTRRDRLRDERRPCPESCHEPWG
jgi:signal transduction histidine kinase